MKLLKLLMMPLKFIARHRWNLLKRLVQQLRRTYCHETNDEDLRKKVWDETYAKCYEAAKSCTADKHKRIDSFEAIVTEFLAQYTEENPVNETLVKKYYHDVLKEASRRLVLDDNIRLDGRKPDEIRQIICEIDPLPATHGSALFTRGETQSLTTVTLGTKLDEKIIDDVLNKGTEKFTLHYNFPPFATGEAKACTRSRQKGNRSWQPCSPGT